MIIGNHLRVNSFCAHHLLPYFGEVTIGVLPDQYYYGLSKYQRIIDKFASRPTVQEELTEEIAEFFMKNLNPLGVGVAIRAVHSCVLMRGTRSMNAEFTTSKLVGKFKENISTKDEFLKYVTDSRLRL